MNERDPKSGLALQSSSFSAARKFNANTPKAPGWRKDNVEGRMGSGCPGGSGVHNATWPAEKLPEDLGLRRALLFHSFSPLPL